MAGKSLIGALRVTLGLDSAQFTAGTARARKDMTTMQKGAAALKGALVGMIGLETINQFRQMGREALNNVDALGEQAVQIGVNTTALQQYRFMAGQVGVENDQMDKGLTQLTRRIGEAIAGNEKQSAAFQKLGVSLVDTNGKARETDAVFADVAEVISKLPSASERAAASASIFGAKIGQTLLPALELGKKGLLEYQEAAVKAGIIISEETIKSAGLTADALKKQDDLLAIQRNKMFAENAAAVSQVETLWQKTQLNLYKSIASISDFFSAWREGAASIQTDVDRVDAAIWEAFENFNAASIAWANDVKKIWVQMGVTIWTAKDRVIAAFADLSVQAVQYLGKMVTDVRQWIDQKLAAVWKSAEAQIERVKKKFFDLYDAVVGNSYIPDMVDEIGQHMARLTAEMVQPASDAVDATAKAFAKGQQNMVRGVEVQNVRIVESFADMVNGTLGHIDRLVKGIQSGNVLDIVGGLLNAVDGVAKLFNGGAGLAGLFGGGGGGSSSKIGNVPKMANGGSFMVGGFGGTDRNLLSVNGKARAWVSGNERVDVVNPANDRGGAGGAPVVFDLRGAVMTEDLVRQMNQIGAQAAVAGARGGASLARAQMAKMQGRQLA
jgi:hypothetical protein